PGSSPSDRSAGRWLEGVAEVVEAAEVVPTAKEVLGLALAHHRVGAGAGEPGNPLHPHAPPGARPALGAGRLVVALRDPAHQVPAVAALLAAVLVDRHVIVLRLLSHNDGAGERQRARRCNRS